MPLGGLRPWIDLVRFEEYGPLFILCGLAGSLYAGVGPPVSLISLLAFIGFFSASAFVLNDITDWREDAVSPGARNPISTGAVGRRGGHATFLLLAAASFASLYFVSERALFVAPVVYGLYWGYSWGPAFKARPGIDVVVHGAVPALFVVMGYALYSAVTPRIVIISAGVFCFAAMSGVLQEVRDLDKDASSRRTTVVKLGRAASIDSALALAVSGVCFFGYAAISGALPSPMLGLLPLSYFVLSPLLALRAGRTRVEDAIASVRARGLALTLAIFLAYVVLINLSY